ncbi:hypothetical protein [uncultured Brachyspira sp.]|uniref:hypothetical protein n=1 Tax=uncultured Brachyspira sp. TaxID=221953 RepID=UPI0025F30C4F|nr:hypothetical protein [uncultured Brachyspira sp.]
MLENNLINKKNEILLTLIFTILSSILIFVPYLEIFSVLKIFFILTAFLLSPVSTLIVGTVPYIVITSYYVLLELVKIFSGSIIVGFITATIVYDIAIFIVNVICIILSILAIYFSKKSAENKKSYFDIKRSLISGFLVSFITFINHALLLVVFYVYVYLVNNMKLNFNVISIKIIKRLVS